MTPLGVGSPVRPAGLTGYRYVLAVLLLITLTSVPTLLAVAAGAATLSRSPSSAVDSTPFVTYPVAPPGSATPAGPPDSAADRRVERAGARHSRASRPVAGDMREAGWWTPY